MEVWKLPGFRGPTEAVTPPVIRRGQWGDLPTYLPDLQKDDMSCNSTIIVGGLKKTPGSGLDFFLLYLRRPFFSRDL